MKYVRTKDGRIFEKEYLTYEELTNAWYYHGCFIDDGEAIAEADSIEELCDEAVFFDKDNKPHYKSQEGNIWYLGASLFTETLRFGIFTDKGLIYVAKMNDKGELELL